MTYYLVDGIYPQCSTFVKTILAPIGVKKLTVCYNSRICNDWYRAYILSALSTFCHFASTCTDVTYMKAFIFINNMIVEDKWDVQEMDFDYK